MQTIMRQLLYSIAAGTDTVLVTIAAQTGSAPRGVGSQMLGRAAGAALRHNRRWPGGALLRRNRHGTVDPGTAPLCGTSVWT